MVEQKKVNYLKIFVFLLVFLVIILAMKLLDLSFAEILENWEIVTGAIGLFASLLGMYAKATGSKKAEKAAVALNLINDYAQEAVEDSEDLVGIEGKVKKKNALGYIRNKCLDNGVPYNDTLASALIEKFVVLSNKVGARHKAEEDAAGEQIGENNEEEILEWL